ncbi:hypothetical protein [Georgenia sp. SYP-B2076]|uniref:hypothetical protein n=1 Tax=Georgenia sp. SYP-B2076 TaxID=2495881 RepID=UPI000F8CECE6|nr:hypothetical protein [Georgenia sp. SYP-B2076]
MTTPPPQPPPRGGGTHRGWRRLSLGAVLGALARPLVPPQSVRAGSAATPAGHAATLAGPAANPARLAGTAGGATAPHIPPERARGVPVTLGGAPARQRDATTCGPAVLLMLAATGDPVLATWLEEGALPAGLPPHRVPPEIPPALVGAESAAADRLDAAQQHLQARTCARGLGPVPWPRRLGTPPWTAAREARFPGVRYRSVPLDDASPAAATLLARVHAATAAGVPVPLYAGGDLGRGLATAVPRHVVLAVPPPPGGAHRGTDPAGPPVLHLYDPASARVYAVPLAALLGRREPLPALGGWTHVCWVLLPTGWPPAAGAA